MENNKCYLVLVFVIHTIKNGTPRDLLIYMAFIIHVLRSPHIVVYH
jgi:hypothetical protein